MAFVVCFNLQVNKIKSYFLYVLLKALIPAGIEEIIWWINVNTSLHTSSFYVWAKIFMFSISRKTHYRYLPKINHLYVKNVIHLQLPNTYCVIRLF